MKGFYLTISNSLLEPKHRQNMKDSVWLFMWYLDKMTSISEEGVGKVLGGKPITYEEVYEDLGIPRSTYQDYFNRLKRYGYINVVRTPYGIVVSVNKAQKTFNQKSDLNEKRHISQRKTAHPSTKNDTSNIRQDRDKTVDTKDTDVAKIAGNGINDLIFTFKRINPSYEKLYSNKTERKALEELVEKYGYQKILNMLSQLPDIIQRPYAPRITTPLILQKKLGELIVFLKQEKGKEEKNGKYRGIDATHL